jgi:hypothetical protein
MTETDEESADPPIEALQDTFLMSEHRAAVATRQLAEMMEERRRQAEAMLAEIGALRENLRNSEIARLRADDENRHLSLRVADLERQLKHVHANFLRLSEGYSNMVRVVEDTHSASLALDQRIENMVLHNDIGLGRHVGPLQPARRVAEFQTDVFPGMLPRREERSSAPPEYRHDPRFAQPHEPARAGHPQDAYPRAAGHHSMNER